ncbi:MAG: hypothetical protein ACRBBW_08900 [Cellvibrionaceae bacterium]
MFSPTVLTVIAVNLIILLVVSWTFLIVFLISLRKDKERLSILLEQAIKNYQELKALLEAEQIANRPTEQGDDALAGFIEDMEQTSATVDELQQARSEQLQSLEKIEAAAEAMTEDAEVKALKCELATLKSQIIHSEDVMLTMKTQATANRHRLSVLEEKLENSKHFPQRIGSLEEVQRKLRGSNKQLMEKLEESRLKVKSLNSAKAENTKLKSTLDNYILKNKNSERLITNLQDKLAEVQGMLDSTKQSIESFSDQPEINIDDAELVDLQETLSRALREKQFIEEQYLELLDKVEQTSEVADQLQRSQNECAMLEQSYLTLMTELEKRGLADGVNEVSDAAEVEPEGQSGSDSKADQEEGLELGMSEMDGFDEELLEEANLDSEGDSTASASDDDDEDFKLEQI